MIVGSYALYVRNLINRRPHDIDFLYDENLKDIKNYLKKYNIFLDLLKQKHFEPLYEEFKYKNRYIKIQVLYQTLYYKYLYHKDIKNLKHISNKYPPTRKHEYDLINVFHNLGKEKSLEEINKIKQNTPLVQEDIDELIRLMEIGINNAEEI